MKINRLLIVMLALLLPSLLLTGVADAAPKAPESSLTHVSGSAYGDEIGFDWSFSGRAGQYPRLHIEMLCWPSRADAETINFNGTIAYGNVVYLDGGGVETLYPGSGTAYFWTSSGGIAPWTTDPSPVYYCRARLLDWSTQGIKNQSARFWNTTPIFEITDSRTP
jgi:hypothetical protein